MPKNITITDAVLTDARIERVVAPDLTVSFVARGSFNLTDASGNVIYSKGASLPITAPASVSALSSFFANAITQFKTAEGI